MINSIDFITGLSYTVVATLIVGIVNWGAVKLSNYYTGNTFNLLWRDKTKRFSKLAKSQSFDELKRRLKIVIIDDEDIFPITLFKDNGYNVEKWDLVIDYSKLESGFYDIIVLDILGIAQHISEDDGFGVLENLKNNNPSQIIIAYSAHSYDLSKRKFWEMADETIAKPSRFLKMKEVIDNVITTKFHPHRYLDVLTKTLKHFNIREKEIKQFENSYLTSVINRQVPDWNSILYFTTNQKLKKQIKTISKTIVKNFTEYGS